MRNQIIELCIYKYIHITIQIRYNKNFDKLAYLEALIGNSIISLSIKTIILYILRRRKSPPKQPK